MGYHNNYITINAFLLIAYYTLCNTCKCSILPGDYINGSKTIVSPTGSFALGFFSPGNSSKFYVGIWFHDSAPKKTIVWVANRNSPLNSPGEFKLEDGNFLISDSTGKIIWSTNITSSPPLPANYYSTVGSLTDDGNLLLLLDEKTLWESFNTSSDTALPGKITSFDMKTGQGNFLSSWKDEQDPTPGPFTFGVDPKGYSQFLVWNNWKPYWRSDVLDITVVETAAFGWHKVNTYFFSYHFDGDEHYMTYGHGATDGLDKVRFLLNSHGQIGTFMWVDKDWIALWLSPSHDCEFYGSCGANGVCDMATDTAAHPSSTRICRCLPNFKPRNKREWEEGDWSGGCVVEKALECNNGDGFFKVENIKLPDRPIVLGLMNVSRCEMACLQNCSCSAYAYFHGRETDHLQIICFTWYGDLLDLVLKVSSDHSHNDDLYLRTPLSTLGGNGSTYTYTYKHHGDDQVKKWKVGVGTSIPILVIIITIIIAYYNLWQHRSSKNLEMEIEEGTHEVDGKLILFNFQSILSATNNFSETNKLGEGGFGSVYKGNLGQDQIVAIKRLSNESSQGLEEFKNELKLIANLQHINLVRLLGCCVKDKENLLVYEYMTNRSLDKFLFDQNEKQILDWSKRFRIIEGIAQGLLYLHKHSRLKVIHRDLKASNILLDGDMNPKISDFGMARIFDVNQSEANTNRLVGTHGYMPSEYVLYGKFSEKSDVFSFGVLLMEIVSGRKNADFYCEDLFLTLQIWAWEEWKKGNAIEIIDPSIRDTCSIQEVERCIHIGLLCLQEASIDRPTMSSVVFMLRNQNFLLPSPKQPAFWVSNRDKNIQQASYNNVTITQLHGR